MSGGLKRLLITAAVVAAVLSVPTEALADGGNGCSACQIYVEPNVAGTGKSVPLTQPAQKKLKKLKKTLKKKKVSTKDAAILQNLGIHPGYGRTLETSAKVSSPGTLAAAFDLGPGPLALVIALLATALGFGVRGGLRGWRRWRTPPVSGSG